MWYLNMVIVVLITSAAGKAELNQLDVVAQTKDLAPTSTQDYTRDSEELFRFKSVLGNISQNVIKPLEVLNKIEAYVTKSSKPPAWDQSEFLRNFTQGVTDHLDVINEINAYAEILSKAPALDHSEVLGNFTQDEMNHLKILNEIKSYANNISKALALNQPKIKTVKSLYRSDRERLNIRTPSGVNVLPRIIGGSKASIEMFPYIVQIFRNGSFSCGGFILTTRHIATAAHCLNDPNFNFRHYLVRAGSSCLNKDGSLHKIAAYILHPQSYQPYLFNNDIAIALLDNPLIYVKDKIQKATLPPPDYNLPENASVIVAGWGLTNIAFNANLSLFLNHVAIPMINQQKCYYTYLFSSFVFSSPLLVTEEMFCAGYFITGGRGSCKGDSGGPVVNDNVVVGMVCWEFGCASGFPAVYTRISSHINWIHSVIDTDEPKHMRMMPLNQASSLVAPGVIANVFITFSHFVLFYCTMFWEI